MPTTYEDRLRRVIDYIYDHAGEDLSLDTLADVAAMSRFHWHRVFRAMTGETCAKAVRRGVQPCFTFPGRFRMNR